MTTDRPEHQKAHAVQRETQAAGDFLDWLQAQGWQLIRNPGDRGERCYKSPTQLLAEWQGIDLDALEREKRTMLDELHRQASNDR